MSKIEKLKLREIKELNDKELEMMSTNTYNSGSGSGFLGSIWEWLIGSGSGSGSSLPSGTLSSNDQGLVSATIWVPEGIKSVRFSCWSNAAPIPVYNCRTNSFGSIKSGSDWGTMFTWTEIVVPLAASNTYAKISFSTTDSNGGMAKWSLVK